MTAEEEAAAKAEETLLTGDKTGDTDTSLTDGDTQKLPHAWMAGCTAEQKADADLIKSLERFEKGIPDLVPAVIDLEAKLSKAIVVPSDDATDEEKATYRTAVGVPEKPEDYKLGEVKLPEGFAVDEEMQKGYLAAAHAADMNPSQTAAIHSWYMKMLGPQLVEAQKIEKTTIEEAAAAVRQRHGSDADAVNTYMERGFKEIATPALHTIFKRTGLGNHPDIIDAMIKIGKLVSETPFVDPERGETEVAGKIGERSFDEMAKAAYPKQAAASEAAATE